MMQFREQLNINDTVILYEMETDIRRDFTITGYLSDKGGSTLVYKANHRNGSTEGILKEFYPVELSEQFERDKTTGALGFLNEEAPEFSSYLERRNEYLGSYNSLRNDKEANKILYSFIPYFEIYKTNITFGNKSNIYIWTPLQPVKTFEKICENIQAAPDDNPKYNIYIILNSLANLTKCVRELHRLNYVHRDLHPENFGFEIRGGGVSTQSIQLFDINTLCGNDGSPLFYHGGFTENTNQQMNLRLLDIYSIGANLFYAINTSNGEGAYNKGEKEYNVGLYGKIDHIVDNSELFRSVKKEKNYSRLKEHIKIIIKRCLSPYTENGFPRFDLEPQDDKIAKKYLRYNSAEELYNALKIALSLVESVDNLNAIASNNKWFLINQNMVRAWFDEQRKEDSKRKRALLYHFYLNPLYDYINGDRFNVLLLGLGRNGFYFLDTILQIMQNLKVQLKVTVVLNKADKDMQIDSDAKLYLGERPELVNFFEVNINDESISRSNDSYGCINFIEREMVTLSSEEDFNSANGRWYSSVKRELQRITESEDFDYVYVDIADELLNKAVAEFISDKVKAVSYSVSDNSFKNNKVKENIIPVSVKMADRINNDEQLKRMAFNVHLVWNANSEVALSTKEKQFAEEYYNESSLSFVLSIKYKVHEICKRMNLTRESYEDNISVAKVVNEWLINHRESAFTMAYLEHRRWVTEKICDGWTKRSIKKIDKYISETGDITKDEKKKSHVCIVKSNPTWKLEGLSTTEWDNPKLDMSTFDELDKASIRIHRYYASQSFQLSNKGKEDYQYIRDQLSDTYTSECFEEWIRTQKNLNRYKTKKSSDEFYAANIRLKDSLFNDNSGNLTRTQKKSIYETLESSISPFLKKYEYKDYKKIDIDLIKSIPFILTYERDLNIIYPLDTYSVSVQKHAELSTEYVFKHVAASLILNPAEITFLYCYSDRSSRLSDLMKRIQNFISHRKLSSQINMVIFYTGEKPSAESFSLLADGGVILNYVPVIDKDSYCEAAEKYLRKLTNRYVICERTNAISEGWLSGCFSENPIPMYQIDLAKKKFKCCDDCEWIKYVKNNVSIDIKDIVILSGKDSFSNDSIDFGHSGNKKIWKLYKGDTLRWKNCAIILETGDNSFQYVVSASNLPTANGGFSNFVLMMPPESFYALKKVIRILIEGNYIFEESSVELLSDKVCAVKVRCSDEMRKILSHILSKQVLFNNPDDIITIDDSPRFDNPIYDRKNENPYNIYYDGLEVKDLNLRKVIKSHWEDQEMWDNIEEEAVDMITNFFQKGLIHGLKIKNKSIVSFSYGNHTIKKLIRVAGFVLELKVYQDLIEYQTKHSGQTPIFDHIYRSASLHPRKMGDEMDCIVTKGFKVLIIECKAWEQPSQSRFDEAAKHLNNQVSKYGISSKGLLLVDSRSSIKKIINNYPDTVIIKRLGDIKGDEDSKIAEYIKDILDDEEGK